MQIFNSNSNFRPRDLAGLCALLVVGDVSRFAGKLNTEPQVERSWGRPNTDGKPKKSLRFFYNAPYEDMPNLPTPKAYKTTQTNIKSNIKINEGVKVYPNPAKDLIFVDYSLSDIAGRAQIKVVNSLGQTVYTGTINDIRGIKSIDTKEWLTGVYNYTLYSVYGFKSSGSFIVKHE